MITARDLRNFPNFKRLMDSTTTDETRYHLTGVYLEQDSDATLVATDGHRLFTCTSASVLPLLPSKLTAGLIYNAKALKAGGINVIEGNYPNWQQLMPNMAGVQSMTVDIPKWFSRVKTNDNAMMGLTVNGKWTSDRGALAYFNIAYVGLLAGETVSLQIKDALSPCLVTGSDWKYVIMPMRGPK